MSTQTSSSLKSHLMVGAAAAVLGVLVAVPEAGAVSAKVKFACAKDYYAHCSKFSPNSPEVRTCMDAVGEKLSKRCVDALVADGEVSKGEVHDRAASLRDDD
jgi:hypothetical protein